MNTPRISELEAIARDATIALLASEGWAHSWADQPEYFKKVLALEADLEKVCRDYLRNLSKRVNTYIDWSRYHQDIVAIQASEAKSLEAYDVNVVFNQQQFQDQEANQVSTFISEIYLNGVALGFAGERARAFGVDKAVTFTVESPITQAIQDAYQEHEAQLAQWLDGTTSKQIVQSIQESIALGENQELATQRLMKVIDNPARAGRIAQTETVRAYHIGERTFATRNGATTKTWEALPGADDGQNQQPCVDNDGVTVGANDFFPSGDLDPPAHPLCRCNDAYNYPDGQTLYDV